MKYVRVLLFAMLLFALTASLAFADLEDQQNKGWRIPEVPFALIYPAAGLIGYGVFRVIRARK